MRIGFVQPYDSCGPPDPGGSLGIWTWEVARRLARHHDVMVCTRRFPGLAATEQAEGVGFFRFTVNADGRLKRMLRVKPRPLSLAPAYYDLIYLIRAAISLRAKQCRIIHLFNLARFAPVIARLNRQARIILNMHCDFLAGFDYSLVNRHLRHVNRIIGCSDFITDDIRSRFPRHAGHCGTAYNGVDLEKFSPGLPAPSETLLTVGRISPEKGLHILLEAFAQVLQRRPNVQLKIIGRESILPPEAISKLDLSNSRVHAALNHYRHNYLQRLREQASKSCRGQVSFLGALPPAWIPMEMQAATVLVQPSLYETFGMPPLEAMACGRPVVASRAGGLAEIVADGETGLLVEPENPAQLADALLKLLENPALATRMGLAGRRRAEMFSWEATVGSLLPYYTNGADV